MGLEFMCILFAIVSLAYSIAKRKNNKFLKKRLDNAFENNRALRLRSNELDHIIDELKTKVAYSNRTTIETAAELTKLFETVHLKKQRIEVLAIRNRLIRTQWFGKTIPDEVLLDECLLNKRLSESDGLIKTSTGYKIEVTIDDTFYNFTLDVK